MRTPAVNERVYTISANGSPLADSSDVFITVPVGGGEVNHTLIMSVLRGWLVTSGGLYQFQSSAPVSLAVPLQLARGLIWLKKNLAGFLVRSGSCLSWSGRNDVLLCVLSDI